MYDIIIIGAGPAGMAAAIYAGRAKLNILMIEKEFPGGQVVKTYEVANYPGIASVIGPDLAIQMQEHAKEYGVSPVLEEVVDLELSGPVKKVVTSENTYEGKSIIIATGSKWRKLDIEGESEFLARGVSYCATCDGNFFRDKTVAVVGGGNTAVEDALYLARLCKEVYLVHRRDSFTAEKIMLDKLLETPNIKRYTNATLESIYGTNVVESIQLNHEGVQKELMVNGVFIAIGMNPHSEFLKDKVALTDRGYIITNQYLETSEKGVYAAGDVREKHLRQIITACSDGAEAVSSIEKYLVENF